jgi:hypothetical protein
MKFEIGQMVKCVKIPHGTQSGEYLSLGAVYTVRRSRGDCVYLEGQPGIIGWYASRFVAFDPLVESILEIQKKNA